MYMYYYDQLIYYGYFDWIFICDTETNGNGWGLLVYVIILSIIVANCLCCFTGKANNMCS